MTVQTKPPSYWDMAALGFTRGAVTFPLEHVLERMKLESQSHPEKTTRQAVKDLWDSQGPKGFYTGSRANFVRRTGKEIYHWPIMLFLNRMWKDIIPEKLNKENLTTNIATGNSMAFVQAGITLPLERLMIEKARNKSYMPFIKKMIETRRPIVYEGFQATLIRHSIVWDLFYIANHGANAAIKKIDLDNSHPYMSYIAKTTVISTFVVGTGYPLEFLRNRILMEPQILSKGTLNGIKELFHRYKWTKLYTGSLVMLVHNFIQTLIIQKLIESINKR